MELREWLIILGLALVTLIVIDGVRRLQRQRQVPRLDRAAEPAAGQTAESEPDPDEAAREAELSWELPNGGARVVRPAESSDVQPKPKLQRQDHPGPSRVLSEFRRQRHDDDSVATSPDFVRPTPHETPSAEATADSGAMHDTVHDTTEVQDSEVAARETAARPASASEDYRREPALDLGDGTRDASSETSHREEADHQYQPLSANPDDHDPYDDEERYRLVDLEGMGDSLKTGSKRMGTSVHRFGSSLQKSLAERREQKRQERAERKKREEAERQQREEERAERRKREEAERQQREQEQAERQQREETERLERARQEAEVRAAREAEMAQGIAAGEDWQDEVAPAYADEAPAEDDVVKAHPVLEKALRHDVSAEHARQTLSHADEVIVISVMSRDERGFSGTALLDLMLACGLRYGRDMGIFHRFETDDPESPLQFSMVNVVKPGTFPIEAMDDFQTPGVTLLLPLPSTCDTSAAFEAMVETAMVVVRHLGGELKDENLSVMTAQTVEFARQRVHEFERRHRLSRYQVN